MNVPAAIFVTVLMIEMPSFGFTQVGPNVTINTTHGLLRGIELPQSYAFLGVPFAKPPVNELRLQDPQVMDRWDDIRDAKEKSPGCMQVCVQPPDGCPASVSEDCLYLNVWVPKTGRTDYPTLIFMHGGNFRDGSGSALLYDGRILARDADAIIITINYRTEVFGWLFLGDVFDPATGSKESIINLGLKDQQLAFKWAKDNIAQVGGDPNKITISGQSAGAQSVGIHLLLEDSRNLFDQALMFSNPYSLPFKMLDDGIALGTGVADIIGCEDVFDLGCWRSVSAEDLLAASREATNAIYNPNEILQIFEPWSPAVGPGTGIPEEIIVANQMGMSQRKPTMLGTMREEGRPYIWAIFQNDLRNLLYRIFLKAVVPPWYRELIELYPADNLPGADQRDILTDITTDYIFYCPSLNVSLSMIESGYEDFFFYIFDTSWSFAEEWTDDYYMCQGHPCHGGDLPYIFRSVPLGNISYTEGELEMMNHFTAYITNFLHTGDPNKAGTPEQQETISNLKGRRPYWPKMREKPGNSYTMYFNDCGGNSVFTNYRQKYCDVFNQIGYYSVPRLNSIENELSALDVEEILDLNGKKHSMGCDCKN